jgi:hypothetical protein
MADNPYKRQIVNMAITILREGKTSAAGQFHTSIDDTEFADYTTASTQGLQRICFQYPIVLKEVLRDIQPDFAKQFADLSDEILINKEIGSWEYLFEFPSDYLALVSQVAEGNRKQKYDSQELVFDSYAHVVKGTDSQAWYCSADHTAASDNKPITGASYATYWTLYNTDETYGADWTTGWSYKSAQDGKLLAANHYSNDDDDSAYIEYIPYVQAGINDKPLHYTDEFKRAFAVRLAVALTKDPEKQLSLLKRYSLYEKPQTLRVQNMNKYIKPHISTLEARTK